MTKSSLDQILENMDPIEAANEMAVAAKKLFSFLGEEALKDFLAKLIGDSDHDKTIGLVHL